MEERSMRSIFVGDAGNMDYVYASETKAALCAEAGLTEKVYSKEEILSTPNAFGDVTYIFSTWGMPRFEEEEIKRIFPALKCVFYGAGSVQGFAAPFLNCGVKVFSAWAANGVPVAEYTVAQIILANKGFFSSSRIAKSGNREAAWENYRHYRGNYGAKVGIIGAGVIGKMVIKKLKEYRLEVMVFDPFLPDEKAEELGVEKVSLERIFSECNVITNHLANNSQTVGMLNDRLFERMVPYAIFINTGRGAQVVEEDLIAVLKARPDLTAVLDVTWPEPPVEGSAFYMLENCVLTPHIAGSHGDEVHRMSEYMLNEFRLYTAGEKTNYEVTLKMLETMA
ncbi:MAG: hydroxyacid dehydrogenase [Ruminococcaceae bacterium]|nr:hydroxyacid dehydrogenase [Oscillospiraceae bacterium]